MRSFFELPCIAPFSILLQITFYRDFHETFPEGVLKLVSGSPFTRKSVALR